MPQEYFQLGGYRPQIQWFQSTYDDKQLAEVIANPSSPLRSRNGLNTGAVELVLGIKPSGASHLLLTGDQTREFAAAMRLPLPRSPPFRASNFESLSPILFWNVEELTKKLVTLKPKVGKGRGGDNSQANRGYTDDMVELYRGSFEHGRLLFNVLNKSVQPTKFGVDDLSWIQTLRVTSLLFNTRGIDDRHSSEKIRNPSVLDIGICDAHMPTLRPNHGTAQHISDKANAMLGRKQPKKPFRHGESETLPNDAVRARLRVVFQDRQGPSAPTPMILLVYHAEQTLNYLKNMGVDTSHWRSGIKDLLMSENSRVERDSSPPRYGSRDPRKYSSPPYGRETSYTTLDFGSRSRSRSPSRRSSHDQSRYTPSSYSAGSKYPSSTTASSYTATSLSYNSGTANISNTPTPARQSYPPVYVLDVRELFARLMISQFEWGVVEMARTFRMTDEDGWCAGNEAVMIIDIWRDMVSSLPIDDQRILRSNALNPRFASSSASATATASAEPVDAKPKNLYDEDSDEDPNDFVFRPAAGSGGVLPQTSSAPVNDDPYNFDQSDYGGSDDDD
ncbi:hypothetical protein NLJ89_g5177 [Agrocybe chaxingu]|uniref:Uncharacterized protein n=1 Tax=Agrocybe chaxingu TaxID=84603 RepID=A0A9W8K139_9AGAR|nr:hypothetical protein NLJ89_g5177 [Agrocybe chaxingu]